jgi:hypothetical protein
MKCFLSILFLLAFGFVFGQTLHNWNRKKVDITVDPKYLLKDTLTYSGTKFNYKRVYKDKKFMEYGNVDANNKASGPWLIFARYTPVLKGVAENGFKIDRWTVENCGVERNFFIYKWNADRTETYIESGSYKPFKLKKRSGKKPRKIMAK